MDLDEYPKSPHRIDNLKKCPDPLKSVHPQVMVSDRQRRKQIMSQKRYRPEEIIAKLREAEVLLGQGSKVPEVVKAIGVSEVSYYRWRKEYGGLNVSQAKRLKELERENLRLRQAVSDLTLDKLILQEAARGNF